MGKNEDRSNEDRSEDRGVGWNPYVVHSRDKVAVGWLL